MRDFGLGSTMQHLHKATGSLASRAWGTCSVTLTALVTSLRPWLSEKFVALLLKNKFCFVEICRLGGKLNS